MPTLLAASVSRLGIALPRAFAPADRRELDALSRPRNSSGYAYVYGDEHGQYRVRFRFCKRSDKNARKGCYVSLPGRHATPRQAVGAAVAFLRHVYGADWCRRPVVRYRDAGPGLVPAAVYGAGPAFGVNGRLRPPVRVRAADAPGRYWADYLLAGRWRAAESRDRDGAFPDPAAAWAWASRAWLGASGLGYAGDGLPDGAGETHMPPLKYPNPA